MEPLNFLVFFYLIDLKSFIAFRLLFDLEICQLIITLKIFLMGLIYILSLEIFIDCLLQKYWFLYLSLLFMNCFSDFENCHFEGCSLLLSSWGTYQFRSLLIHVLRAMRAAWRPYFGLFFEILWKFRKTCLNLSYFHFIYLNFNCCFLREVM